MEGKTCIQCGEFKPITAFDISFAGQNAKNGYVQRENRKSRCKTCYALRDRVRTKLNFIKMYGGQCACCGESDPRFLTLDHVGSDGNEHRKELACNQIMALAIKHFEPSKYQVQCYNCNCGRSANGGICPHKDKSLEDYLSYTEILLGPACPSLTPEQQLQDLLKRMNPEDVAKVLGKL